VRRALLLAVALSVFAPAAARAQNPAPTPAPAPVPAPPPVPQLALQLEQVYRAGQDAVALRGQPFVVRGAMLPAVAGQPVQLRLTRHGRPFRTVTVATGPDGSFVRTLRTRRTGGIGVRALHPATPQLGAARGPKVRLAVAAPRLAAGSTGPLVRLLKRGLAALHYAVPRHGGSFGVATARAVMAFRKVNGMPRRYDADRRVITKVLAGKGAFKPRHPEAGHHVEADLSRQVLALIDGGDVVATYVTSSGAPGTPTVIGTFKVYLKTAGFNAKGMLDSNYFIRGYAIHGYVDVPAFNASHGCLRVPIPDAARIYRWVHIGDRVIVYP
jgi:L,D-transpeptidase-like protein